MVATGMILTFTLKCCLCLLFDFGSARLWLHVKIEHTETCERAYSGYEIDTEIKPLKRCFFNPGWNFLSITWRFSAQSTGLKFSVQLASTGLEFQPGLKLTLGWNFCHVVACCVSIGFYPFGRAEMSAREPGWVNRDETQPGLKTLHAISPLIN